MIPTVNILSSEFKANPYPFYAQLRAEAPVHRVNLPDNQFGWLVTRYDDVQMILKDDRRFIKDYQAAMNKDQLAKMPWLPPVFKPLMYTLLALDGEEHARLRGLVHKAFTPAMIEQMRTRVETLANSLLDNVERKGQMDLIRDYALPIPLTIISEILGISERDRDAFRRYTKQMLALSAGTSGLVFGIPSVWLMMRLLRRLIAERRKNPQNDLITALVQAEEAGDKMSEDELISMIFILLLAGYETTINLIGSGAAGAARKP
jgi:cytochrome P450